MRLLTAVQSGLWSSPSVWGLSSGYPGQVANPAKVTNDVGNIIIPDGDLVVIPSGINVELDVQVTLGGGLGSNYPDPDPYDKSWALNLTGGSLTIDPGAGLLLQGHALIEQGATFTCNGNGYVQLDGSLGGCVDVEIGHHSGVGITPTKMLIRGASPSQPFTIATVNGDGTLATQGRLFGGMPNCGCVDSQYASFNNVWLQPNIGPTWISNGSVSGGVFKLDHCALTGCGMIQPFYGLSPGTSFEIINCTFAVGLSPLDLSVTNFNGATGPNSGTTWLVQSNTYSVGVMLLAIVGPTGSPSFPLPLGTGQGYVVAIQGGAVPAAAFTVTMSDGSAGGSFSGGGSYVLSAGTPSVAFTYTTPSTHRTTTLSAAVSDTGVYGIAQQPPAPLTLFT